MTILRIIVESAVLYTAAMITVTVLYYLNHPGQVIVQHATPPITGAFSHSAFKQESNPDSNQGIVFVLIAVRTHVARGASLIEVPHFTHSDSLVPSWASREDTAQARTRSVRRSMPIVTTTAEQYRMDVLPGRKGERMRETKAEWDLDDRPKV